MPYSHDPNEPANQRILNKLAGAGWIQSFRMTAHSTGSNAGNFKINWTPTGQEKMKAFHALIREIETASLPLDHDELLFLKSFATFVRLEDDMRGQKPPQGS